MNEQVKAALRHRSLSRLGQGGGHPGRRGLRHRSVHRRDRDWPRFGVKGAAVPSARAAATSPTCSCSSCRPGGSTTPQRHLYEEVDLRARRQRHDAARVRRRHASAASNGARAACSRSRSTPSTGTSTAAARERALLVTTTNLPLVMNIFHNERVHLRHRLRVRRPHRQGRSTIPARAISCMIRPGNHMWETNFVPDLGSDRAASLGRSRRRLAPTSCSCSPTAPCTRTSRRCRSARTRRPTATAPASHVMCVTGNGYSLLWYEGEQGFHARRLEARHRVPAGRAAVPPALQHQPPARRAISRPASAACAIRSPAIKRRSSASLDARREERGVAQRQGGRRPDRVRGSGPAHPPALARGDAQERRARRGWRSGSPPTRRRCRRRSRGLAEPRATIAEFVVVRCACSGR